MARGLWHVDRLHEERDVDVGERDLADRPVEERRGPFLFGRGHFARG